MTPAQAAELLAVAAAFDRRTIGELDARAWAKALDGLAPGDCADAIATHYARTTDWLMPGHVRAEVRRIRADRLRAAGNAEPEYDPDDVAAGLETVRAYRRAVADGHATPVPALTGEPSPRLRALLEDAAAGMRRTMSRPSPGYLAASRRLAAAQRSKPTTEDSGVAS